MKNETLSYVLRNLKLSKCISIGENLYYVKKNVKLMCYNCETGVRKSVYPKYEFIIIVENNIKKGIILNCGNIDLHWYVFKKWRGQHVLSNALRNGIIKKMWPDIKNITCCFCYDEDGEAKYSMTKHLASLAGLNVAEESFG